MEGQTPPEGYVYPSMKEVRIAIVLAVVLTICRFTFERLIAEPIGRWFGLRHKLGGTPAGPNAKLEAMIEKNKKPTSEQIVAAAQDADMEIRTVEIWVRRKQRELMPSKLNKFKEALWRLFFYTTAFSYGVSVLWPEEFLWNTQLCWVGFPDLTWAVKKSLYYYYLLEGSFYLSLMVSQFMDTKRKDFWEMFLHHIATLALIGGSWFGGAYKVGAIVMATHDVSDVFLEAAKASIYVKKHFWSNLFFGCFTVTFFSSRLVMLPYKVIHCAIVEANAAIYNWPVHFLYGSFLITLQILHIYWFTFIIKLLIKIAGGSGDVNKDDRSEDETPSTSTSEETENKKDN
ncbi:ceramide synthase 6-like [Bolinopsis microptera]|uniref:ceramide synthase 6-like n=1 Tax=Bolinopsis microptera TaxID=2820187 RepID=UPI00307A5C43